MGVRGRCLKRCLRDEWDGRDLDDWLKAKQEVTGKG